MADTTETGATAGEEELKSGFDDAALNSALDILDNPDGATVDDGAAAAAGEGDGKPPAETDASNAKPEDGAEGEEGAEGKKAGERERDEKGRFKKAEGEGEGEGEGEAEGKPPAGAGEGGEGEETATEQPAEQIVDGRDIAKAPATWTKDAQTDFAKLPEVVRREIHKREEDFHRGIEQYRGAAQFGAEVAKQFQPYEEMLNKTKLAPGQIIDAALEFEYQIRTGTPEQKVALIHKLAKAYGVKLDGAQVVDGEGEGDEDDAITSHPFVKQLIEKVEGLESKLTDREQKEKTAEQEAEEASREEVRKEIAAFAADPKNEFYGQVKDEMLQLIKSRQATDLKSAYDKAIWLVPAVREKLVARQREADRKAAEKAERAARASKAANLNVAPRATPPGQATGKGTLDETLGAAVDQALAS